MTDDGKKIKTFEFENNNYGDCVCAIVKIKK